MKFKVRVSRTAAIATELAIQSVGAERDAQKRTDTSALKLRAGRIVRRT